MIFEEDSIDILCCGPSPEITGIQQVNDGVVEYMCAGRRCAAWRWVAVPNPAYDPTVHVQVYPGPRHPPSHIKSDTEGYCGLAGRP